jgi:tetratricopeptide (TPR) repeat protein
MPKANLPNCLMLALLLVTAQAMAGHDHDDHDHHDNGHDHAHMHLHDDAPIDPDADIGRVDFGADCSEAASAAFDRALAMMHHMMYEQARGLYEQIVEVDPDCAMAHWGIATTLFQPLWGTRPPVEDLQRGWSLSRTAAGMTESERELALIHATTEFFRDPADADYATRQRRWHDGMKQAHQAHPDDLDIAALFGLALLAEAQGADDPHPLHERAEALLRAVHADEATHPGAIHYLIHGDDIDGRADRNLDIVEAYGQIAPQVPHALHMPSHIYVRLGDWPEVIDWNVASAEAALNYPAGELVSHHYPHAQDYLIYAHLQRGEDDQARRVLEETMATGAMQRTPISAFHVATMPARIAVERRDWHKAAELKVRQMPELPWDSPVGLWSESQTWVARGLGAVHLEDLDGARAALERIRELRGQAEAQGERMFARYIGIDEYLVAGWLAHGEGDDEQAVEALRRAVEHEAAVEKHPITPGALLPPNEALGDLLMALDRPADALQAYAASDEIWPGRYNTLLGAIRSTQAAGDTRAAAKWSSRLVEVAPESERDSIEQARALAAR